jgi:pimeloyl-ACP methyl ester carboxylesterase
MVPSLSVRSDATSQSIALRSDRIAGVVFGGHWGWLHLPDRGTPLRAGVILCAPLGREARNAHRPLWLFAERLAKQGFALLRYDHLGSGESLGLPPDADFMQLWTAGVEEAAKVLRERTGVHRLVLGGLRVGATLVAITAERIHADAQLLLAPIVKGRTWFRELQFATSLLKGKSLTGATQKGFEADGLWLSQQTINALNRVDLSKLERTSPQVFLASRDAAPAFRTHLEQLGAELHTTGFDEYEALFIDAYVNQPPKSLLRQAEQWLDTISAQWPSAAPVHSMPPASLTISGGAEHAVAFGEGLRGILTIPNDKNAQRTAVVVGNTGGDPRAGIGSFTVAATRRLCEIGVGSLRFDFAGLGDSAFAKAWRSHVFETPRTGDFAAAVEVLTTRGFGAIVAAGVCSGGYHALHAAVGDRRIAAAYAVNTEILAWRDCDALDQPGVSDGSKQAWLRDLHRHVLSPAQWRRLMTRDISLRNVSRNVITGLKRRWIARFDGNQTRTLRRAMKQLTEQGGRARILVGEGDCSLDELETHFGRNGRWLTRLPGMSVGIVSGIDHGLFFRESQDRVLNDLLRFVGSLSEVTNDCASEPVQTNAKSTVLRDRVPA